MTKDRNKGAIRQDMGCGVEDRLGRVSCTSVDASLAAVAGSHKGCATSLKPLVIISVVTEFCDKELKPFATSSNGNG